MRASRPVVLGPLLILCLVLSACGTPSDDASDALAGSLPGVDPGATARESTIDRYEDGVAESGAAVTPELIGMTVTQAQERAATDGFDVRVIPFDPTSPVTEQSPAYGQPAPLDRVIEIRQGSPEAETETPEATSGAADAAAELEDGAENVARNRARGCCGHPAF